MGYSSDSFVDKTYPAITSGGIALNEQYLKLAIDQIPDRMKLINVASRRARDLARGHHPTVVVNPNDTPTYLDVALREIAEGKITYEDTE